MKRNHAGLLAIALVLGISAAVAANINAKPKAFENTYNWTSTSIAPQHPNSVLLNATHAQAVAYFGCEIGNSLCATGVSTIGLPDDQIKYN